MLPTLWESQDQGRSPLPWAWEYAWTKAIVLTVVWPRGLREGGRFGGSVPGWISAPRLLEGMQTNGVQPAGVQLGAAESSGFAINVVSK